jgi:hypothetical protein
VVDHCAQDWERGATYRPAIEVDVIRSQQPLAAQFGPVTVGVSRKETRRGQRNRLAGQELFGSSERNPEKRCCDGRTADKFASKKQGIPPADSIPGIMHANALAAPPKPDEGEGSNSTPIAVMFAAGS